MADSPAKRKLVEFLEHRAFNPVMGTDSNDLANDKREMLAGVQRETESRMDRIRHCASAEEVVDNFRRDLRSDETSGHDRDLRGLGLPRFADIQDDFEQLARSLGVQG
jgi:hypothetical protein